MARSPVGRDITAARRDAEVRRDARVLLLLLLRARAKEEVEEAEEKQACILGACEPPGRAGVRLRGAAAGRV